MSEELRAAHARAIDALFDLFGSDVVLEASVGSILDDYAAALSQPRQENGLDSYMADVVKAWRGHWEGRNDHRYGRDFAAFLGERLMNDFNLGAQEPYPFGPARLAAEGSDERR